VITLSLPSAVIVNSLERSLRFPLELGRPTLATLSSSFDLSAEPTTPLWIHRSGGLSSVGPGFCAFTTLPLQPQQSTDKFQRSERPSTFRQLRMKNCQLVHMYSPRGGSSNSIKWSRGHAGNSTNFGGCANVFSADDIAMFT
jgi:hypothetical protein